MHDIYNDLLAILSMAEEMERGELPEGISPANIKYIKELVMKAAIFEEVGANG